MSFLHHIIDYFMSPFYFTKLLALKFVGCVVLIFHYSACSFLCFYIKGYQELNPREHNVSLVQFINMGTVGVADLLFVQSPYHYTTNGHIG